jgi:hypothetical protein
MAMMVSDYERRAAPIGKSTPGERLQELLSAHGDRAHLWIGDCLRRPQGKTNDRHIIELHGIARSSAFLKRIRYMILHEGKIDRLEERTKNL